MSDHLRRFESGVSEYDAFRPDFPDELIRWVACHIADLPAAADSPIVDVGSGTGTFTRQLSAALPDYPVIGIEPSAAMRAAAQAHVATLNVTYVDGCAEALPVARAIARAVVCATAAHWFDRPQFYLEAARTLMPGGLLAIAEYVRDERSLPARAALEFLNEHGEPRAYSRPDYVQELSALSAFSQPESITLPIELPLTLAQYAGLVLSSSHARKAISDFGREKATELIKNIGRGFMDDRGFVPFGYIFQAFIARRI